MKLAIVTSYPPSKVTLNEYAYHLVKHFRQNKSVSEIVLLTDKTPEDKDINFTEQGCKITVKECWKFNSYLNIFTVNKAITDCNADTVLFNLQFMKFGDKKLAAALGLMIPMICSIKKIPNIVLLHNILEEVDLATAGFTENKIMKKVYGFIGTTLTKIILKADVVAVTMQKYVKVLEEKYKANNIKLIPHGTFEIAKEPNYKIPKGPIKVMTFGKFGTYKKVEGMIEAVEMIRKRTMADIEIVIAGTDNPNVPGYLSDVKLKYHNVPKLRFTGYVEEEQVAPLFQESAVVVFPYTSTTGSSGVLHQAGSYGKAVVMPDIGDLALLVQDEGYRGEFFKPTSVSDLANAIEKIIFNPTYRVGLGKENYKAATAYPMSKITEMYIQEFEQIILKEENKTTDSFSVTV